MNYSEQDIAKCFFGKDYTQTTHYSCRFCKFSVSVDISRQGVQSLILHARGKIHEKIFEKEMKDLVRKEILMGYAVNVSESNDEERIKKQIGLMGGTLSNSANVTCIVTSSQHNRAYIEQRKPVISSAWVDECWSTGTRAEWNRHRYPFISVTGFHKEPEKIIKIKDMISKNGGTYEANLDLEKNSHLICKLPLVKSPKYEAAIQNNIKVVSEQWIIDCLKQKSKKNSIVCLILIFLTSVFIQDGFLKKSI
jgi:hypothetical protein